jgi:hypothetical protein
MVLLLVADRLVVAIGPSLMIQNCKVRPLRVRGSDLQTWLIEFSPIRPWELDSGFIPQG